MKRARKFLIVPLLAAALAVPAQAHAWGFAWINWAFGGTDGGLAVGVPCCIYLGAGR